MTTRSSRERSPQQRYRTCVGCGSRVPRSEASRYLIRFVLVPAAGATARQRGGSFTVAVDLAGGGVGRGAWAHAQLPCIDKAASKGLSRSVKGKVLTSTGELSASIATAARRRVKGLIAVALRSRHLVAGSSRLSAALQRGAVDLVLLATDAAAAARQPAVRDALERGLVMPWADKAWMGAALNRGEVALIGLTSPSIAAATRQAISLAETFASVAMPATLGGAVAAARGTPDARDKGQARPPKAGDAASN